MSLSYFIFSLIVIFITGSHVDAVSDVIYVTPDQSIQEAIDSLGNNGGQIVVKSGTYNEFITFEKSGTQKNPIIVKAEGNVVINGNGKEGNGFDLNGQSNIIIDGFTITNIKGLWVAGILLSGGEENIQILNCDISNIKTTKMGSSGGGANGILLYGQSWTPISNVVIKNNHVYNCVINMSEAISVTGNAEYVSVVNNKVHDNGNIGIDFCGNFGYAPSPLLDQPRHCEAINNIIYNCNSSYATSYSLYADGVRDILFEGNIIYSSQGGIEIGAEEESSNYVGNIIVRNNLVYNCSENGIHVGGYDSGNNAKVEDVKIYNNTFVNNGEEIFLSKCKNVEFTKNIFLNTQNGEILYNEFDSSKTVNVTFRNNLYYTEEAEYYFNKKSYSQDQWKLFIEPSAIYGNPTLDLLMCKTTSN